MASTASSVKDSSSCSVDSNATVCFISEFSGSVRMRTKSSLVRSRVPRGWEAALEFGHEVAGLGGMERAGGDEQDVVGADRAVLGVTVEPSTMGRRSRCTPPRETSGPDLDSAPAILSISSMKMMRSFRCVRWRWRRGFRVDEFVGFLLHEEFAGLGTRSLRRRVLPA